MVNVYVVFNPHTRLNRDELRFLDMLLEAIDANTIGARTYDDAVGARRETPPGSG